MSEQELIQQIKTLSQPEQALVADFLVELQARATPPAEIRYMDQVTFRAAKERVFAKHAELLQKLAK